jgi:hypothetical protein
LAGSDFGFRSGFSTAAVTALSSFGFDGADSDFASPLGASVG